MSEPLDFYFDFSSPYGYLASEKIDALAGKYGRKVRWHPVLLGVIFKATGATPLTQAPLKGEYSLHDFSRSARFMGIPYAQPANFPIATQHAARSYYWLHGQDCALARRFAHTAYRAYFAGGRDISSPDVVLDLAASLGADRAALAGALAGQALKDKLREACENALKIGVFGSPYVVVDGEPFCGADRLPQIGRWLESGGF
ncbi:MAG: 2-hydroxychromene-2-carboxylate isomerase [Betaproteobacteria bacterium]|nr:2-hydroxychromene-2-carboxylate isomerase [Betaproteobacteria bacterium]